MGGAGKTTLAAAVVRAAAPTFEVVIWRSLLNAPPLAEIVQNWLQILARQTLSTLPDSVDEQLRLLLTYLRQQRCLLVLDNLESILQPGAAGEMRPGYEGYAQLLQYLAGGEHQSVLLLTSREQPQAISRFVGQCGPNRAAVGCFGCAQHKCGERAMSTRFEGTQQPRVCGLQSRR